MGGRGSSGSRNSSILYEAPEFNTKYYKSTTQQMKDLVTETYKDMQQEFPILAKAVEFDFYNGGGYEAIGDSVSLDGRHMKKALSSPNTSHEMWVRSTVAHELTHVIQERMGRSQAEEMSSKILGAAIDRYVKDNAGTTREQVLKDLKTAYGLRTLDSDTSRRPMMERMAVAVENHYMNKKYPNSSYPKKNLARVGSYVAEELQRELRRR